MKAWAFEVAALGLFIVLGGAGLWAAGQITGISFDPLGSTAAPYVIGGAVILLSLACVVKLTRYWPGGARRQNFDEEQRVYTSRDIVDVLGLLGLIMVYVFSMFNLHIPFSLATLALLPIAACILDRSYKTPHMPVAVAVGAFIGFGGELLFTKVFFVDLPTLW